ncbi:class I SAM-dependent methyltransferase [Streptomyces sp. NPDC005181]|uniref:class I SAM-dependent methyltransferase n=1 Tax=Streptomyces sp. NPDC005181 TaxID=3156869 RepID=UPI0033BC2FAF
MTSTNTAYWEQLWREGRRYRSLASWEEKILAAQVGPGRGRAALDIGCGTGELAGHLSSRLSYTVTAIDCSPTALAAAEHQHGSPGIDFRLMDFAADDPADLPQPAYALVTCRLVFRWMPDKGAFLDRVRRVLAPGGVFWVATSLHDPEEGPAQEWDLSPADAELLTANWSVVRRSSSRTFHCLALRP